MKLQTTLHLKKESRQIDYQSRMTLLGSCFAEHIAQKLNYFKFSNLSNPFGVLFHPIAIENLLKRSLSGPDYTADEVFCHNEIWQCYDAHSDMNHITEEGIVENLNRSLADTDQQINKSTHIIITLGTAWVYRHLQTDHIVANCHKIPQREFSKELLSVKKVIKSLEQITEHLSTANPDVVILFTVSPVRHLKDGFVENSQSKSHLITAIHQVVDKKQIFYFPAYEIMMDELRDYRFYGRDMVHPNEVAIDFIWERFKEVWVSDSVYAVMKEVELIQKGLQHRPFNLESAQHKRFLQDLQQKIRELRQKYPSMEFDEL